MWHKVFFVHAGNETFVRLDRDLLSEFADVQDFHASKKFPKGLWNYWRGIRKADIIFCWFASWNSFWALLIAKLFRKPSILVIGGYDIANLPEAHYGHQRGGLEKWISRFAMRLADRLLTNSYYSQEEAEQNAGIPAQRVKVIYHGVPDLFGSLPQTEKERMVLTVGKVDFPNLKRKGLQAFVEAAAFLPDVQFVLVGEWADKAIEYLRMMASANVLFTGRVTDEELLDYYRKASVYVQASLHEGFGLSVAEAMLAGCIPVVTRAGSLPEVVGDCGLYCETNSPDAVMQCVRSASVSPSAERAQARDQILKEFPLAKRGCFLYEMVWNMSDDHGQNYNPMEYWDKVGKESTVGTGEDSGAFGKTEDGNTLYKLPKWSAQPQYWDYMEAGFRVLDIGSGNGLQVGRFLQRGVFAVGCDISSALLKIAKGNMESRNISPVLVQWNGSQMPFASCSFDRVTTNTVFQHVVDDTTLDVIFSETSRTLKSQGLLLICELVSPKDIQTAHHVKLRSSKTYERIAARHGLRVKKIRHAVSVYVTIQSLYGKFMMRKEIVSNRDANSAIVQELRVERGHGKNIAVKQTLKKMVSWIADVLNRVITFLHFEDRFAGQDEIVFEKL